STMSGRGCGGTGRRGGFRSRWAGRPLEVRVLSPALASGAGEERLDDPLDLVGCTEERLAGEEEGRRVRDLVVRPVEVVRAVGAVQQVPERNVVADDEDPLLGPLRQRAEGGRVAPGRLVEALAAGE